MVCIFSRLRDYRNGMGVYILRENHRRPQWAKYPAENPGSLWASGFHILATNLCQMGLNRYNTNEGI